MVFKIGDKVKFKEFISIKGLKAETGYVSHIHKGHLFSLPSFEIDVHIGNGEHVIINESKLEIYKEHE